MKIRQQHLHQYAIMGAYYAENVRGIKRPRIGLLNNGTEESKGDPLRKETYQLLAADPSLNFVGNVEARDLMDGVADVIVTDGFTGNAVLKTMEGTALGLFKQLKTVLSGGGLKAKIGAFLLKNDLRGLKKTLDYSDVGGAVLFGLQAPVVKTHGSSDAKQSIAQSARSGPCWKQMLFVSLWLNYQNWRKRNESSSRNF